MHDTFAQDDSRIDCGRCIQGAHERCAGGYPLPHGVPNHCAQFKPRPEGLPPLRLPGKPAGLTQIRERERAWPLFLAAVHENDRLRGGPAMRCPDGVARHPDGSRPGEPPANQPTT